MSVFKRISSWKRSLLRSLLRMGAGTTEEIHIKTFAILALQKLGVGTILGLSLSSLVVSGLLFGAAFSVVFGVYIILLCISIGVWLRIRQVPYMRFFLVVLGMGIGFGMFCGLTLLIIDLGLSLSLGMRLCICLASSASLYLGFWGAYIVFRF